jgi:hypothetical protein
MHAVSVLAKPAKTGAPERRAAERANQDVLQYRQAVHQIELLEDVAGVGAAFADIARQAAFMLNGAAQQLDAATGDLSPTIKPLK